MKRLDGKVALVTGGTSGLGAVTARFLAAEGAAVVVAGRRAKQGNEVATEIRALGNQGHFIQADVAVEAQVAKLVEETVKKFGRLDIAVNNAGGYCSVGPFETLGAESFAKDIASNLTTVFLSMKHEIPAMRDAGGGSIINTASTAGVIGVEQIAGYVAAKHGVIGLTRAGALELAKYNIRVNALVLGPTASESWQKRFEATPGATEKVKAGVPLGRVGSMADVSSLVVYLASDSANFITGAALAVDGGITAR